MCIFLKEFLFFSFVIFSNKNNPIIIIETPLKNESLAILDNMIYASVCVSVVS